MARKVSVDTGTMLLVDPGSLFTSGEWADVTRCWNGKRKSYRTCVIEGLHKKGGSKALKRSAVIVATGGDGSFPVKCTREGIGIREFPGGCKIEK